MRESRVELERNAPLCREVRDFQAKVQACGPPYQQWCAELRAEFPALVSTGGSLAAAWRQPLHRPSLRHTILRKFESTLTPVAFLAGKGPRPRGRGGQGEHQPPVLPCKCTGPISSSLRRGVAWRRLFSRRLAWVRRSRPLGLLSTGLSAGHSTELSGWGARRRLSDELQGVFAEKR